MARTSIYLLVLAFTAPYLYDRFLAFSSLLSNRPGKMQEINGFKSHEIKFKDRVRNCEDVVLDEGMGIAFLSCDPGRDRWNTVMGTFHPLNLPSGGLWIYDYGTPNLPDSDALKQLTFVDFPGKVDFHPLGIEFDPQTATLYAVNHATTGSVIEIFQIEVTSATATHIQTLKHPLLHTPNSIHVIGDGQLYVTNDHYIRAAISPLLSKIETFSGAPGGSVVFVDLKNPAETKLVARVPFANGIAALNSTTLAVASSSKAGVYFFTLHPSDHSLILAGYIRTPAGCDNISVDSAGKLLMAGHPFAPALMQISANRWKCDAEGSEDEKQACECGSPSWAAEWSEEGGLRTLYQGSGFCSSTMAVRDRGRGVGMLSGLYERGVMVFRE